MERRPPNLPNPTTTRQNTPMRHLTVSILVTLAVLLGSAGESFALPECPGSPTKSTKVWTSWNNCEGTATDAKGDKYVGEWKDGNKHGQGTYTYADGDKYVGELKDGKRHGQGTLYYLADNQFKGDIYVGEFKDGKWHGQGTYTYGSKSKWAGDKYVGEFKDGHKHGQGTVTYADGRVKEGIWEYGEFKYAKKTSPVVIAKKTPKPKPTKHVDQQKRLELTRRAQEALKTLGLYSGKLDGIIGVKKKSAIQRWQKRNGYPGTGEVTELQLAKLEQEAITHLAKKKPEPKVAKKKPPKQSPPTKSGTSGSEGWNLLPCSGTYNEDTYADTTWTNCEGTETYASGNKYVGEYKDGKRHGQGTYFHADGGVQKGIWENGKWKLWWKFW